MPRKTNDQLKAEIAELQALLNKPQPDPRVLVGVRIPESIRDSIKDISHEDGREIQEIYAEALQNWIKTRKRRIQAQEKKAQEK